MQAKDSLQKKREIKNVDIVRVLLIKDPDSHYRRQSLEKTEDVVSLAKKFLEGEDREVFITINIDQSSKINSIHVVAIGSLNTSIIQPREVFKTAILSNASKIILAHNHPSGNPNPSDDDSKLTCQIFQCGDLLGIEVLDHIIIGDGKYSHCMKFGEKGKKEIMWLTDKIKNDQEVS
jgi:DNA repair protein RadC